MTEVEAALARGEAFQAGFELPIQTEEQLRLFILVTFGITIPSTRVCAHHQTPWEAFCDAYFARSPVAIWKASRGAGGKSFLLSLLGVVEAITLGADVNVLGGSGEQAIRILETMTLLWSKDNAPRYLLASEPGKKETKLIGGNYIRSLMASQRSVRGPHPQRLRADETDAFPSIDLWDAAMGQPMSKPGIPSHVVGSSTHQNHDGVMTELLRRARERDWPVFEWCVSYDTLVHTPTGQTRICELKSGDEVLAYDGTQFVAQQINAAWSNGEKLTVVITTTEGTVECTPEHKVLTAHGWKKAGDLVPGEEVVSVWRADPPTRQVENRNVRGMLSETVAAMGAGRESENALRVWRAEDGSFEALPCVLSEGTDREEHEERGRTGPGKGNGNRAQEIETRSDGGSRLVGYGSGVPDTVPDRQVRGGLLLAETQHGRGGLRTVARVGSEREERRAPEEDDRSGGASIHRAVTPGRAFVVAVTPGRVVDVWDLSVPGHHSFVANGIVVHNCYRETVLPHGWLRAEELQTIRIRMTVDMWNREMENQEPALGAAAIDRESLDRVFLRELGEVSGELDVEYVFEEPETLSSAQYANGADWAKDVDFTDIATLHRNRRPKPRFVSYLRTGRKKWPIMVGAFEDRLTRYPGVAAHDGTGIGGPLGDYLTHNAEPVILSSQRRKMIITEYIAAIENLEFECPYIENVVREHRRMTAAVFEGKEHLPDSVASMALAWYAHTHGGAVDFRVR